MIHRILLLLACLLPLHAQSWDSLSGLKSGDAVRVIDAGGQEHKGSFSAVSSESLTIRSGAGTQSIERAKVRQVKMRSTSKRIRNLLIGVGIGVGVGIAVDQSLGRALRNEGNDNQRALMYVGPIGLFGGIGGAFPAYRTVYRSR